jgi:hypothetical protein
VAPATTAGSIFSGNYGLRKLVESQIIPSHFEALERNLFNDSQSLQEIAFETWSLLQRIE